MSTRRRFLTSLIASLALLPVLCRAAKAVRVELVPEPANTVEVYDVWKPSLWHKKPFAHLTSNEYEFVGTYLSNEDWIPAKRPYTIWTGGMRLQEFLKKNPVFSPQHFLNP